MAHLKKWVWQSVVAVSLVLPASEVFADQNDSDPDVAPLQNTFICPISGKGSAEMVVILDPSVLAELGSQQKKKKNPKVPTGSVREASWWVTDHTGCKKPSDAIKINELCLDSTYQCAFDAHSGASTKNVGQYHGFLPLNKKDLDDLTGGWDKLVSRLKKDGTLGTRIHDALRDVGLKVNYIPDYARPILNDGSRQYDDPWTKSACLKSFLIYGSTTTAQALAMQKEAKRQDDYEKAVQKNQADPGPFVKHEQQLPPSEQRLLAEKKNQADSIELECGQREGEDADRAKARERALWRSTKPKEPIVPVVTKLTFIEDPKCDRIMNVTPGSISVPQDCSYVRGCAETILQNTCRAGSCGWRTCLEQYKNFCRDGNCLVGSDTGRSRPISNGSGEPTFNMADVTGRALRAIDKLDDKTLDCGLREEWKKHEDSPQEDTDGNASLSRGCSNDETSLRYLRKVLKVFNDDANGSRVNTDFAARASDPKYFNNLRNYISTFASSRQGLDPDVKASLLEISSSRNFLDWINKNQGGQNYLGHTHTAGSASFAMSSGNSGTNPFQIMTNIEAAAGGEASPVSCLIKYNLQSSAAQNAYFQWITEDYRRARNLSKIIDVACPDSERAPVTNKPKVKGVTH